MLASHRKPIRIAAMIRDRVGRRLGPRRVNCRGHNSPFIILMASQRMRRPRRRRDIRNSTVVTLSRDRHRNSRLMQLIHSQRRTISQRRRLTISSRRAFIRLPMPIRNIT